MKMSVIINIYIVYKVCNFRNIFLSAISLKLDLFQRQLVETRGISRWRALWRDIDEQELGNTCWIMDEFVVIVIKGCVGTKMG